MKTQNDISRIGIDTVVFYGANYAAHKGIETPKPSMVDTGIFFASDYYVRNYADNWLSAVSFGGSMERNIKSNIWAFIGMFAKDILYKKDLKLAFVNSLIKAGISAGANELVDKFIPE